MFSSEGYKTSLMFEMILPYALFWHSYRRKHLWKASHYPRSDDHFFTVDPLICVSVRRRHTEWKTSRSWAQKAASCRRGPANWSQRLPGRKVVPVGQSRDSPKGGFCQLAVMRELS